MLIIRPKRSHILAFISILLLAEASYAALHADINNDGEVNLEDFAILAGQWLSDSNEASLDPKYEVVFPSLGIVRNSTAYDADFRELPENVARYEDICIASRPTVTINTTVERLVQDIDGDLIICSDYLPVYITTDGTSFTKLFDISTYKDFVGYYEPNDNIRSITVMPDGSWMLSFGQLWPGGAGRRGHLFRSLDKGLTWKHVLEFERGYVDYWGWCAISNNEVAIGEYGYLYQSDNPRRVYYSDDYGATWSKIYEPAPASEHCHFAAFKPGDTNVLYASYDCPATSSRPSNHRVIKVVYTPGVGGKRNIANWSEAPNSPILTQGNLPVCAFSDGKYLYLGHDSGMSPVLWRLDPSDDSAVPVMDWPQYYNDLNHPYQTATLRAQVFGMVMYEGIYYAAVRGVVDYIGGGIYVSTDGEHWACAYRVEGVEGFANIVGFANGYLWGTFMEAGRRRIYKASPVRAELVKAMYVERGITNQLNTPASSSFEGGNGGWAPLSASEDINLVETGVSTEMELDGSSSYKIVCERKGFNTVDVCSGYCPVRPSLGDYICASFWIKGAPTWPNHFIGVARIASSGGKIDSELGYFDVRQHTDWEQKTVWGRCTDDNFTNGVRIWLGLRDLGYTGNYSNATCYVDCAQIVYFSDLHYAGSWQIGGTPRANEVAVGSLVGLGAEFTTAFDWKPERSRREWHGNVYIASWTDGQEHIDLYYDQARSKFVATDGMNTAATTRAFSWDYIDNVKFAFTNMNGDFRLSVSTPLNGAEHVLTDNGNTKLGPPVAVTFGTNSQRTSHGCGLIANVKHFDLPLTISEIQKLFDLVETSGR